MNRPQHALKPLPTPPQQPLRAPDGARCLDEGIDQCRVLRVGDICRRYGISADTLMRWRRHRLLAFPIPIAAPGAPRWFAHDIHQWFRRAARAAARRA